MHELAVHVPVCEDFLDSCAMGRRKMAESWGKNALAFQLHNVTGTNPLV